MSVAFRERERKREKSSSKEFALFPPRISQYRGKERYFEKENCYFGNRRIRFFSLLDESRRGFAGCEAYSYRGSVEKRTVVKRPKNITRFSSRTTPAKLDSLFFSVQIQRLTIFLLQIREINDFKTWTWIQKERKTIGNHSLQFIYTLSNNLYLNSSNHYPFDILHNSMESLFYKISLLYSISFERIQCKSLEINSNIFNEYWHFSQTEIRKK